MGIKGVAALWRWHRFLSDSSLFPRLGISVARVFIRVGLETLAIVSWLTSIPRS